MEFVKETWVLKKREEQRLETAQMAFLIHLLGITKLDKRGINVLEKNGSGEHSKGNKTVPGKWLNMYSGWTQTDYQTSTKI